MLFVSFMRCIQIRCRLFCIHSFSSNNSVHQYFRELLNEYQQCGYFQSLFKMKREGDNELYNLLKQYQCTQDDLVGLVELQTESQGDDSFVKSLKQEVIEYESNLNTLKEEIVIRILPEQEHLFCTNIMLEVCAGVGGQEAMLFAADLFNMYLKYVQFKNWSFEISDYEITENDGIRHGCIFVSGKDSFKLLCNEGGVHRVQRIPLTEKSGRIHTSTATVAILPQPSLVDVVLKDKDLKIETKTARGPGGQRVNKIETAVRIYHIPSKLVVECQVHRSQEQNKTLALQKLRTMLYEKERNQVDQMIRSSRKLQVGSRLRNEKVRTYNFNQDRITDHRFGKTVYNLSRFLSGETEFHEFLIMLSKVSQENQIKEFLQSLETLEKTKQ